MRKFFRKNKTRILADALIVVSVYATLLFRNKKLFDKFLGEHGLLEEYYLPKD
jgi:hypothetical protein